MFKMNRDNHSIKLLSVAILTLQATTMMTTKCEDEYSRTKFLQMIKEATYDTTKVSVETFTKTKGFSSLVKEENKLNTQQTFDFFKNQQEKLTKEAEDKRTKLVQTAITELEKIKENASLQDLESEGNHISLALHSNIKLEDKNKLYTTFLTKVQDTDKAKLLYKLYSKGTNTNVDDLKDISFLEKTTVQAITKNSKGLYFKLFLESAFKRGDTNTIVKIICAMKKVSDPEQQHTFCQKFVACFKNSYTKYSQNLAFHTDILQAFVDAFADKDTNTLKYKLMTLLNFRTFYNYKQQLYHHIAGHKNNVSNSDQELKTVLEKNKIQAYSRINVPGALYHHGWRNRGTQYTVALAACVLSLPLTFPLIMDAITNTVLNK